MLKLKSATYLSLGPDPPPQTPDLFHKDRFLAPNIYLESFLEAFEPFAISLNFHLVLTGVFQ